MNILLVEDDEDKRAQLMSFLEDQIDCSLTEVRSFQSALKALKESTFDLLLFDMSLPTFDVNAKESGGRALPFGGKMLMYELVRRKVKSKVIVVTQFDVFGEGDEQKTLEDLDKDINSAFGDIYLGSVQYSVTYTGWKERLMTKINKLN